MNNNQTIPNPTAILPTSYKTSCFIKNVIKAPNVSVGDYTYYDHATAPENFERGEIRIAKLL